MDRFRFVVARSDDEIERAAEFRRRVFFQRRGVVFDEPLEARRDRAGHVFLLLEDANPVATARLLPYPSELSPVLSLSQDLGIDADSEIGCIAAVSSPRAFSHALVMMTLGSIWTLRHTRRQRYLAYCHPKLVDLYRLVGAKDIGRACIVPGRSEAHRIVSGSYDEAARLGVALLGITDDAVKFPTILGSKRGWTAKAPERESLRRSA
jgi:hypothetical protein